MYQYEVLTSITDIKYISRSHLCSTANRIPKLRATRREMRKALIRLERTRNAAKRLAPMLFLILLGVLVALLGLDTTRRADAAERAVQNETSTRLEGEDVGGRGVGARDGLGGGAAASDRRLRGGRLARKLNASEVTRQRGGGLRSGDVGTTMTARRDRRRTGVKEAAERASVGSGSRRTRKCRCTLCTATLLSRRFASALLLSTHPIPSLSHIWTRPRVLL
mmetsp:Transcript_18166/g.27336  ORF Transcript_18166/g.27336 Transcript_18166/m.27336 type:complete len:222 (+) Transcript_18166:306-971(+)